jgi:hypothetical protein
MLRPSHPPLFDDSNNIWRRVKVWRSWSCNLKTPCDIENTCRNSCIPRRQYTSHGPKVEHLYCRQPHAPSIRISTTVKFRFFQVISFCRRLLNLLILYVSWPIWFKRCYLCSFYRNTLVSCSMLPHLWFRN